MISWVTVIGRKRWKVALSYLLEGRWLILTTAPAASECSSDQLDGPIPKDEVGTSMLAPGLHSQGRRGQTEDVSR